MKHNQYIKATLLLILAIVLIFPVNAATNATTATSNTPLSTEAIKKKVSDALVVIETPMTSAGGFFVSPDLVLINYQLLTDRVVMTDLFARNQKGTIFRFEGVYWVDFSRDLALLKVSNKKSTQWIAIDESESIKIGDPVITMSSYEGLTWNFTQGVLSGYHAVHFLGTTLIQTDASSSYGCPGSPVLNQMGQAIGVITTGLTSVSKNYATIPIGVTKAVKSYTAKSLLIDSSYDTLSPKQKENFTIFSKRIFMYFINQNKKDYTASFAANAPWLKSGLDNFDAVSLKLSSEQYSVTGYNINKLGDSYIAIIILDNKGHTERCELYIHAKIDPVANRFVNVAVNSIDVMGLFKNNNGQ